jgi:8-oxo-dGTP pyrophosphatase MutT (NUDIX family)
VEREFTVAVFVVQDGRVLLHWHRRLGRWLPPGGHIDGGELPDEAAVRETLEETGLAVTLVDAPRADAAVTAPSTPPGVAGRPGVAGEEPRRLVQPLGIQLEDISPGHQHIDLIYLARPLRPADARDLRAEADNPQGRPGWFAPAEWRALPVSGEIDRWATAAVAVIAAAAGGA